MLCTFCRIWHFFYQDQNQTKRNNTLQKQKNPIFTSCEFSSQIPNCARLLRTGGWRVVMLPLPLLGDGGWSPCPGPPHSHNGSPAPSARQAQPGDPRLSCCLHFGNHIDKHHCCQLGNKVTSSPKTGWGLGLSILYPGVPSPWLITWLYTAA